MNALHPSCLVVVLMLAACGDDALRSGLDPVDTGDVFTLEDADIAPSEDTLDGLGPDAPNPPDTSVADAPDTRDTSAPDTAETAPSDTTDTEVADTTPADTTIAETETPDTTPADTAIADTETPDTTPADTTPADTETPDTAPEDTAEVSEVVDDLPPADQGQLSAPPYLMWVTQTEVSVRWETKQPVIGRVDFGATDALGRTLSEPAAVTAHELRLTGLTPDAQHSYRIVYGGGALAIRHFRTAPPDNSTTPFQFIVWGDNQDGPDVFHSLVGLMADHDPRFAISVGDCVQNGTRGEYRNQLFSAMNGFADEVPYLVAAGNHERYSDPSASLFGEYFSQPGDEHCFGWRYGGLFVLFLDTDLGLDGAQGQRDCVNAQLQSDAARTATIRAAAFHKPPRVEWWFGGYLAFPESMSAPYVREDLEPLLEAYNVHIVFNGHNHLYAHTPKTPGGITWVTTGGGGGKIDERGFLDIWRVGTWPQIETTIHDFHFLVATLDGDELFVEAIDRDGEVMHSFAVFGD